MNRKIKAKDWFPDASLIFYKQTFNDGSIWTDIIKVATETECLFRLN